MIISIIKVRDASFFCHAIIVFIELWIFFDQVSRNPHSGMLMRRVQNILPVLAIFLHIYKMNQKVPKPFFRFA